MGYGATSTWTASDLLSSGWVASALAPSDLSQLPPHSMEGLSPLAIKHLDAARMRALSHLQLYQEGPAAPPHLGPPPQSYRGCWRRGSGGQEDHGSFGARDGGSGPCPPNY